MNRYQICPSTEFRYDSNRLYIYRHSDGSSWHSKLLEHPLTIPFILFSFEPRKIDDYKVKFGNIYDDKEIDVFIEGLVDIELLLHETDENILCDTFLKEHKSWKNNNWSDAFMFHLHTNRIEKIDYSNGDDYKTNDYQMMVNYVANESIPSNYKHASLSYPKYQLSTVITYQENNKNDAFSHDHLISNHCITIDTINLFINNIYSQTDDISMIVTGKHVRKAVPSGGARHPTECYLLVADDSIDGIDIGIYYYNVKNHCLDILDIDEINIIKINQLIKILKRDRNKNLKFAFINTTIFCRSMHRYREPRSYRVMHFDIGHIMSNFSILSKMLGLDYSNAYSIPETPIESILGLDFLNESVMSASLIFENHE